MNHEDSYCPRFQHGIEVIGKRWSGAILNAMCQGATRYREIKESIPGLTDRLLSDRLRELEAEGIVTRLVTPEVPVAIRYHLTEKGRELLPIILAVSGWAEKWIDLPDRPHSLAGDALPEP